MNWIGIQYELKYNGINLIYAIFNETPYSMIFLQDMKTLCLYCTYSTPLNTTSLPLDLLISEKSRGDREVIGLYVVSAERRECRLLWL